MKKVVVTPKPFIVGSLIMTLLLGLQVVGCPLSKKADQSELVSTLTSEQRKFLQEQETSLGARFYLLFETPTGMAVHFESGAVKGERRVQDAPILQLITKDGQLTMGNFTESDRRRALDLIRNR